MCTNYISKHGRVLDCGKCIECLKMESWRWTQRIKLEAHNVKTWFCTFTYAGKKEVGYKELQDMFKRLRKGNKKKNRPPLEFRYLTVSERGEQNGRLHFHAVIHGELTRRQVESEWLHGFSNAKLMKANDKSRYIAKYMTKAKSEEGGKFYRASLNYGTKALHKACETSSMVKKAMEYFPNARTVKMDGITIPYKYQYKLPKEQKTQHLKNKALRRDGT